MKISNVKTYTVNNFVTAVHLSLLHASCFYDHTIIRSYDHTIIRSYDHTIDLVSTTTTAYNLKPEYIIVIQLKTR